MKLTNQGLYFEEFELGQRITSPGRTITEADVVTFAGLSGDFNSIHTDAEYVKNTAIGQRVAHGLLIISIVSGLAVRTGIMEGTVLAFREIKNWKFSQPVFIGETIHVIMEVTGKKAMPQLGGGSILLSLDVRNQDDQTVMRGIWTVLVQSQAGEA
ncbi:MAG: dehydratase [Anaerolineales bacterium]|nr:MAG: dehydratase [Anaerolineales bacterium]